MADLESFREEWRASLATTKPTPDPPRSIPNRRMRIESTSATLEESLAGLTVTDQKEPATALEFYASAVAFEAEGRLNDGSLP